MINITNDIITPFSNVIKQVLPSETAVILSKAVLNGKVPKLPYSTLLPLVFMYRGRPSTSKVICTTDVTTGKETCEYTSIQGIDFHIRVQLYGENALGKAVHLQTELLESHWRDLLGDVDLTYHKGSHARETNVVEDTNWTERAWFDAVLSTQIVKKFKADPLGSIEFTIDVINEEGAVKSDTFTV